MIHSDNYVQSTCCQLINHYKLDRWIITVLKIRIFPMIIGKIQIFKMVICHWLSYWQAGSCGLIFPCLSKAIYRLTLHVVITCEITWAIVMAFAYLAKINDVNVCRKCKVNRGLRVFFNGCPHFHTPASMNVKGGYIGFILTVRLSVCPSFCGWNRVRSVSWTILAGFISYLHILSSNFRRCITCKVHQKKFQKFMFWQFFLICSFNFVLFWLGIQYESIVWVIMGQQGVSSEQQVF